jgi:hypothetical protein
MIKLKDILQEGEFGNLNELPAYSSPEAKLQAEHDLIKMSKILGKASNQSIKLMMNGVKVGKYTSFDLRRVITSGNVSLTHKGERDFLEVLWNKVKHGFKRYSKKT